MEENQSLYTEKSLELLNIELFNASNYLERLIFVLHDHKDITHLPSIKKTLVDNLNQCIDLFNLEGKILLNLCSENERASILVESLRTLISLSQQTLKLSTPTKENVLFFKNMINAFFHMAFELHLKVDAFCELDVQTPPFLFSEVSENQKGILKFELNEETIQTYQSIELATVKLIDEKKELLYDRNLKKGHFFLLNKNFVEAKSFFEKAKIYKQTSEVYTLLGHIAHRENKVNEAKEYCLKAIKVDPNFGAAYNDYGVYILNEGHARDAIKWFKMAQKCKYYQNRDFAFINLGRAYFALNEYELALDEFTKALTINPQNHELLQMVQKIRANLETSELKMFMKQFSSSEFSTLNQ